MTAGLFGLKSECFCGVLWCGSPSSVRSHAPSSHSVPLTPWGFGIVFAHLLKTTIKKNWSLPGSYTWGRPNPKNKWSFFFFFEISICNGWALTLTKHSHNVHLLNVQILKFELEVGPSIFDVTENFTLLWYWERVSEFDRWLRNKSFAFSILVLYICA